MKKRLLITSIVMMLVVAVALSTATYAWFTSSAKVESTSISLTAATNTAASLGISWTDGNYGPEITAASPAGSFSPACPNELVPSQTTIGYTPQGEEPDPNNHNIAFNTALATPSAGDMVFKYGSVAATNAYTWSDTGAAHQSFFIKNLSPANSIASVTVKANISANNLVRVAIFKWDEDDGYYHLLGVLANKEDYTYTVVTTGATLGNGTYYVKRLGKYEEAVAGTAQEVLDGTASYEAGVSTADAGKFFTRSDDDVVAQAAYGTIVAGQSVNAMTTTNTTDATVGIDITEGHGIAANEVIQLKVLVWEDAIALGDAEASTSETTVTTSVALSFEA